MTNKDKAYEPFQNIKNRLNEIGEELGLECHNVVFTVGDEAVMQVVWTLKGDAVMTAAEKKQAEVDDVFESMVFPIMDDPLDGQVDDVKESLRGLLEKFKDND